MLRERRPARSIVRAEDPLEVGIYANDDLARDVRIGEGSVREDERAPPRMLLFRRRRLGPSTASDPPRPLNPKRTNDVLRKPDNCKSYGQRAPATSSHFL